VFYFRRAGRRSLDPSHSAGHHRSSSYQPTKQAKLIVYDERVRGANAIGEKVITKGAQPLFRSRWQRCPNAPAHP
jgi:hypothetical protein